MIFKNKNTFIVKIDTHTLQNELFEMRDILSIIASCSSQIEGTWVMRYYEFNDLVSPIRNNRIIEYLENDRIDGLNLSFQEIKEFADSIFQTIECEIQFKQNNQVVSEIINFDTNFWEIKFYKEDIYHCFLNKKEGG